MFNYIIRRRDGKWRISFYMEGNHILGMDETAYTRFDAISLAQSIVTAMVYGMGVN